jgi:O-antigen/teichoic acid export membrane protein
LPQRVVGYSALSYWQQLTEYLYSLDFVVLAIPIAGQAASFKIAFSLINQILGALWSPLAGIQIPLFARLHTRDDSRQLGEAYTLLSKFLAAVMIPAAVGLSLLSYNIIVIFGAKYVDAAWAARILALSLFLDAAISVPLAILMAYERFRPMLIARTCALVALPLVFFVVPRFGLVGAALVMGGVRLFCDGLAMAFALRHFSLRYPVRFVARVVAATLAMAMFVAPLALSVLQPPLPWDLASGLSRPDKVLYGLGNAALGGIGALIYLGVFRLTGGIDEADRRRIAELRLPLAGKVLRFL